jgi:predicted acetylornithine/succinylornithine family transaminase
MKIQDIYKAYEDYIMPTYQRLPVIFVKGKGSRIWDIRGREYLDFFPGWGVSGLGHCHPKVIAAIKDQARKLIHISNNYHQPFQAKLARKLIDYSFDGKVFFCNSGAEANEAAIKLARVYGYPNRYEIIYMKNSFHGRTLGTLAATGQEKYREKFIPLPEGFKCVEFNNIDAINKTISDKTVGIILELIQGEGGINVADKDYVLALRQICREKDILLIIDEVQTGMGRTGKMFCFQHYGIEPDAMTLAKALGGGLPIGAMVVKSQIADTLKPGMHASTFGGSPLVCKASLAVFETIRKERLLTHAVMMGEYLFNELSKLKNKYPIIKELRGKGLMWGIELTREGKPIVEECLKRGLLINCTQEYVLRLMPALIVTGGQINKAIAILDEVLSGL